VCPVLFPPRYGSDHCCDVPGCTRRASDTARTRGTNDLSNLQILCDDCTKPR